MLLGVATNAQTRSVSGFPRVGGGGGGVGGDCGARSASLSASHPQSRRRRAGKSEVQPGLEANKARRRLGGAPVPLFLCCSSWLAGWGRAAGKTRRGSKPRRGARILMLITRGARVQG